MKKNLIIAAVLFGMFMLGVIVTPTPEDPSIKYTGPKTIPSIF